MVEWLQNKIKDLGAVGYTDVEVKPFQKIVDGVVFGLVANDEYEVVELRPSSTIAFFGYYQMYLLYAILRRCPALAGVR